MLIIKNNGKYLKRRGKSLFFFKLAKRSADKLNDFILDTTFNAVFQREITLSCRSSTITESRESWSNSVEACTVPKVFD